VVVCVGEDKYRVVIVKSNKCSQVEMSGMELQGIDRGKAGAGEKDLGVPTRDGTSRPAVMSTNRLPRRCELSTLENFAAGSSKLIAVDEVVIMASKSSSNPTSTSTKSESHASKRADPIAPKTDNKAGERIEIKVESIATKTEFSSAQKAASRAEISKWNKEFGPDKESPPHRAGEGAGVQQTQSTSLSGQQETLVKLALPATPLKPTGNSAKNIAKRLATAMRSPERRSLATADVPKKRSKASSKNSLVLNDQSCTNANADIAGDEDEKELIQRKSKNPDNRDDDARC
jgi:hypothetical protein